MFIKIISLSINNVRKGTKLESISKLEGQSQMFVRKTRAQDVQVFISYAAATN